MHKSFIAGLVCILAALGAVDSLRAQGTAFTYQGQLNAGGSPAGGSYDFTFTLYSFTNLPGTVLAGPITNSAVTVTNGLFTTMLDFGSGIFTGSSYWLQIGVRTNGGTIFTALLPRQQLTPTPYAIFANTASNLSGTLPSSQLSGAVPSSQISGTYSSAVTFSNGANSFIGVFTGNGSSLSNLNASQLTSGTVADLRLSTNVALLNANQKFTGSNLFTGFNTFTGTNNLTGVNSFTNTGNIFQGSFFGNGLVGWIPTSATAVQAARDTGYMLTSPSFTTVTLPPTAGLLNGDIVRVSGAGAGGWQVKANSGQSILGNFAGYNNSYLVAVQSSAYYGNYGGVAASASGTRMYAVGNGIVGVQVSSDSGRTWSQSGTFATYCFSVACSANGQIVYAEPVGGGTIQMSSNAGATWGPSAYSASGVFISCTADGSKVFTGNIACSGNGTYLAKLSGGVITISTNGGSTFNVTVTAPAAGLTCLAASSDCTRLVSGVSGGLLYGSANLGATWTTIVTTNQTLSSVWMSADGSKFATAVSGNTPAGIINNYAVGVLAVAVATNSISASQGSAAELQYIGNNQFMPVSSAGTLWAN
jgi:hypothetical protein